MLEFKIKMIKDFDSNVSHQFALTNTGWELGLLLCGLWGGYFLKISLNKSIANVKDNRIGIYGL